MTDAGADSGWFESVPPDDLEAARKAIENGTAETPKDWPTKAVEAGFAEDTEDYYEKLHAATVDAAREAAQAAGRADDQQLIHALRAMDDMARILV